MTGENHITAILDHGATYVNITGSRDIDYPFSAQLTWTTADAWPERFPSIT